MTVRTMPLMGSLHTVRHDAEIPNCKSIASPAESQSYDRTRPSMPEDRKILGADSNNASAHPTSLQPNSREPYKAHGGGTIGWKMSVAQQNEVPPRACRLTAHNTIPRQRRRSQAHRGSV